MVENQYVIDISTNANPTSIEELSTIITETIDKANELSSVDVDINTDDALGHLDEMNNLLDEVYGTDEELILDINTEEAVNGLDNAKESASGLKEEIEGIDPSPIEETGEKADEAADKIDGASDSISVAGAGAGALAGIGIGAFFMEAAESAGTASDSLTAIDLNLQKAGASASMIRNIDANISAAANETGRSAGKVRTAFQSWTAAGVTTGSTMERLFEIGSATAFTNPRVSLEGFTGALQMSIQRGTLNDRILQNMGTSMDQLTQKTGYTKEELNDMYAAMTPDERASFLAQYAGDMKAVDKANADFKNSWEGTKEAVSKSVGGIIRSIGDVMLPSLVPALQLAADVLSKFTDGFKWLNSVTGGAAGWFVGIVGGLFAFASLAPGVKLVFNNFKTGIGIIKDLPGTVTGAFNKINTAINGQGPGVNSLRYKYNNLKLAAQNMGTGIKNTLTSTGTKISGFATTAGGKLKSVGTAFLNAGRQALISAGRFVLAGAQAAASAIKTGILTIATWLQTAAQTALNIVMSINPIYLIIMAIVALIAVLAYLYYNNETVRNAINGLWAGLQQVGQVIYGVLIGAWNALVGALTGAYNAVVGFVTGGIAWISQLPARIQMYLTMVIGRVLAWGINLINQGRATATKFVGTVVSFFTSLPGKIYNAIKGVVNYFKQVFTDAGMAAYNAMLATPILGDLIRAGGDAISWLMGTAGGDTAGGDYVAGGDFTTASTGYTSPNLDNNINKNSNNIIQENHFEFKGITEKDTADYIVDVMTRKTKEELLKIGKAI